MINLLGPRDDFLRILEEQLQADLHVRGGRITLSGEAADVAKAAEVLDELITILRTGQGLTESATIRKISGGIGVERTVPLHSPKVAQIEVLRRGTVRQARLYYLRDRVGKKARIKEKRDFNKA